MKHKGFDLGHIKLIWNLNNGAISFEEYLIRRGLSPNDNLGEINYLVNDNHIMLNDFLSKVSIGIRCRIMKGLFDLSNREVDKFVDFKKSSIGYFISENMELNKDSKVISTRNTSLELIYDLAIIYDLPFRYLANTYTKYEMMYSFDEYNTPKIKIKNLHELIEETLNEMKNKSRIKRNIFGVKIINDYFSAGDKKHLYSRVDIREQFFTIEIHLANEANINPQELLKLESSIGMNNKIFIRNSFLRVNRKLCILISIDDSFKPNIIYLPEECLWRNVLFNLKEETLEKLNKEALPHKYNNLPFLFIKS